MMDHSFGHIKLRTSSYTNTINNTNRFPFNWEELNLSRINEAELETEFTEEEILEAINELPAKSARI